MHLNVLCGLRRFQEDVRHKEYESPPSNTRPAKHESPLVWNFPCLFGINQNLVIISIELLNLLGWPGFTVTKSYKKDLLSDQCESCLVNRLQKYGLIFSY